MEKEIKRCRIIDYEEFKRNYKGKYDRYIVKINNDKRLYTLQELEIIENIKNKNLELIEKTIKNEGNYIEYIFEGEIEYMPIRIILSIPTKMLVLDEYEPQHELISNYLKEMKQVIKILKDKNTKQNIEMLKYIRNIIIASGISVGILFTIRNKQQEKEKEIKPKVVYETPEHKEDKDINEIIKRIKL